MNSNRRGFGRFAHLIIFSVLCLLVYSSGVGVVLGQKKPKSLKLDVDMDDSQLCNAGSKVNLNGTQFCNLYWSYTSNLKRRDFNAAQADRNEMIDIVRGQVDTFYKLRKDGRRTKIRWYQTILDFLQIGGDLSIAIMNGDRAKSIVGAGLTAIKGGRTNYDKNFEVLQTQALINTMNKNRAEILTEIYKKRDKPVRGGKPSEAYTWYEAKNDLRRYLLAGTFDNALDVLVTDTGNAASEAEKELNDVIVGELPDGYLATTKDANKVLIELREALKEDETKEDAEKALRAIYFSLKEDKNLKSLFAGEKITINSEGEAIRKALINVRGKVSGQGNDALVNKINRTIVEANQ
jgi:hypothetical protein